MKVIVMTTIAILSAVTVSCTVSKGTKITKEKILSQTQGKEKKKGRRLTFETTINQPAAVVWNLFKAPEFWLASLNPEAVLKPVENLPSRWETGKENRFKLRMYRLIPFGNHMITFEKLDNENRIIQTREYGLMVPQWDNYFEVKSLTDSTCIIKDVLEIQTKGVNGIVANYAIDLFKAKHKRLKNRQY